MLTVVMPMQGLIKLNFLSFLFFTVFTKIFTAVNKTLCYFPSLLICNFSNVYCFGTSFSYITTHWHIYYYVTKATTISVLLSTDPVDHQHRRNVMINSNVQKSKHKKKNGSCWAEVIPENITSALKIWPKPIKYILR